MSEILTRVLLRFNIYLEACLFNPFVPPKNVKLETYKSTLKTAFAAAVSMSSPLDKIFEEAVNNCYSDFRWLDTYTSDDKGQTFNITDFIKCFEETFEAIEYWNDGHSKSETAAVFKVGTTTLQRWKSQLNETGTLEPKKFKRTNIIAGICCGKWVLRWNTAERLTVFYLNFGLKIVC